MPNAGGRGRYTAGRLRRESWLLCERRVHACVTVLLTGWTGSGIAEGPLQASGAHLALPIDGVAHLEAPAADDRTVEVVQVQRLAIQHGVWKLSRMDAPSESDLHAAARVTMPNARRPWRGTPASARQGRPLSPQARVVQLQCNAAPHQLEDETLWHRR